MSGHTPGPWRIDPRPFTEYGAVHIGCGQYIVATALGQTQSCETEATANARLIAAAPELLEALIRLLENGGVRDACTKGDISQARNAIAKATGGQP